MKTLYYLKRALSSPPHVVVRKIVHKLKREYASKKKKYIDEKFPTYVRSYPNGALNCYLGKIDTASLPAQTILQLNEHFLNHEFNLLGSGWVSVVIQCKKNAINAPNLLESERIRGFIQQPYVPIDWHIDFKSGYRWREDTWSQNIQYGMHPGADVKVPWELSRMQHLVSLAWGYALQSNTIYLTEFQNQILDFMAANPPRYGVNWVCTMDVGIRIANWLFAYDLFRAFGAVFAPEFETLFTRSVYEHGAHIFNHLEWDPFLRSNHYLANIAGLFFVAAYLPSSPEIDSWLRFSMNELQQEVLSQFHPDGSNFEGSTSYHRLSTEMIVYATALAMEMKIEFSEEYLRRIEKMGEFVRDITKPDGCIVQFGDNDSGRFIKLLSDTDVLDHRYLVGGIQHMEGLASLIKGQFTCPPAKQQGSIAYPDFGLYIHNKDPWFLAVRCGSIGQKGNGGHAHNDQLSFELSVNGISMLIDPGTYVYTPIPEARRHFRSTAMHNTLVVDGKEQNVDGGLFRLIDKANGKVIHFAEGIFVGEHQGFGSVHRRTLRIENNVLEGIDECDDEPKQIYFHFAPGWTGICLSARETEWVLDSLKIQMITDQGSWKMDEGEYSRAYGEKQKAPVLILQTAFKRTAWKIQVFP